MKIKINGSYYIEVTNESYDVHFVRPLKKDPTKTHDAPLAYCHTLERAVKRIIQHSMSKKNITVSMDGYLDRYEFLSEKIFKTLEKAGVE